MTSGDFQILLQKAVSRDVDALEKLLALYQPVIEHFSRIDGQFDDDLYQHLLLHIALNISRFQI